LKSWLKKPKQQGRISPRPASARQSIDETAAGGGGAGGREASRASASPTSPTLQQHFDPAEGEGVGGAAAAAAALSLSGLAVAPGVPASIEEEDQPM
jgi:hypothetical protein